MLRNLPQDAACKLAELIETRPGYVSSRSLCRSDCASMTLLSFAAGESVSEERYFGDTMYYLVEGRATIAFPEGEEPARRIPLGEGEVLMVPAQCEHAVENDGVAFKILQITLER